MSDRAREWLVDIAWGVAIFVMVVAITLAASGEAPRFVYEVF